jgi:hypothetical protein
LTAEVLASLGSAEGGGGGDGDAEDDLLNDRLSSLMSYDENGAGAGVGAGAKRGTSVWSGGTGLSRDRVKGKQRLESHVGDRDGVGGGELLAMEVKELRTWSDNPSNAMPNHILQLKSFSDNPEATDISVLENRIIEDRKAAVLGFDREAAIKEIEEDREAAIKEIEEANQKDQKEAEEAIQKKIKELEELKANQKKKDLEEDQMDESEDDFDDMGDLLYE